MGPPHRSMPDCKDGCYTPRVLQQVALLLVRGVVRLLAPSCHSAQKCCDQQRPLHDHPHVWRVGLQASLAVEHSEAPRCGRGGCGLVAHGVPAGYRPGGLHREACALLSL